jgi:phage-related protein
MTNFPLPVKAEIADSVQLPSNILQFGDGYEQLSANGLNRINQVWDVEVAFPDVVTANILQAFLMEHGQHKTFEWQSPRDAYPRSYRILGAIGGTVRNSGGKTSRIFFTRRMRFERATGVEPLFVVQSVSMSLSVSVSVEGG